LVVLSLGGFGGSENRHILNGSSLWKRRARNKRLVILETYRRQEMLGIKVTSSQICNFMIFSESSKSSHSLAEILLLHKIVRYSRRISQARK
jgi:hypothetical protein